MENVKGFKVFNPDWTCRGFQYEVGKTYEENVKPSVCNRGFHFCKQAKDCFNYYSFDPNNKVAEVIALGEVAEEDDKCCTNKMDWQPFFGQNYSEQEITLTTVLIQLISKCLTLYIPLALDNLKNHEFLYYYTNKYTLLILTATPLMSQICSDI